MICDDDFYAGKCPARKEDGRCVSKFPCSHKVEPPKPSTNADRIRAMSDEELARWLYNFFWGGKKYIHLSCILGWLQLPAEDGEDG